MRVWTALAGMLLLAVGSTAASAAPNTQPVTWSAQQANVPAAQALGHGGAGIVVAIVDGWVDGTHPDFTSANGATRVLAGADCRTGVCVPGPAAPDACGHGTHVAGLVASSRYGVAPAATILPVVALASATGGGCSGSSTAVAAGIGWAADHGAQVINLSLADDSSPGLLGGSDVTNAIDAAAAHGILVVVAAGNNATTSTSPGYGDTALVVAATGPSGALASYSDSGLNVQLAAPGGDNDGGVCSAATCIASTWLDHQYALLAGTSMAAPEVSGTAALILGAYPGAARARLIVALESTARPLAGTQFGLLDAAAAVRLAASLRPTTPSRSAQVSPASAPHPSASPKVPAPRTISTQAPSAGDGPRGPWQFALVLLLAVSLALGWHAPTLLHRKRAP